MFSNCQEGYIAKGDRPKIAQVTVGKDDARDNIRIHAMIRAPMIGIRLKRYRGDFAESRFSGGAISGRIPNHEVRTETRKGTIERLMFEANLLNRSFIFIL